MNNSSFYLTSFTRTEIECFLARYDQSTALEQKSWNERAYEYKATIITLIACSAITMIAVPIYKLTASIAVSMFYLLVKIISMESTASDIMLKSQDFFINIFLKNIEYMSLSRNSIPSSITDTVMSFTNKMAKNSSVNQADVKFIKKKVYLYCVKDSRECDWLGFLAKAAFMQLIQDQKFVYKIHRFRCAFSVKVIYSFFVSIVLDNLLSAHFLTIYRINLLSASMFLGFFLPFCKNAMDDYNNYITKEPVEEQELHDLLQAYNLQVDNSKLMPLARGIAKKKLI